MIARVSAASASRSSDLPMVLKIDPPDAATGVLRDCPVVARLSHPVDPSSIGEESFLVTVEGTLAAGGVRCSADGRLLVWSPEVLLTPGLRHEVRLAGLRDVQGRLLVSRTSCFTPCDLASRDLYP